jgi:transposase
MIWIGIDVAKRSFTASKPGGEPARPFTMDLDGWHAFREWIPASGVRVCLEATGPYWLQLAEWFGHAVIPYAVVNPRKVRRFAQASEQRSKTDPIDAELVRRYAEVFSPECTTGSEGVSRTLRVLSRRILQLQTQLDIERDRLEKASADPATPDAVLASFASISNEISRLIEDLEHRAKALVLAEPALSRDWDLLCSIPGIGPKTARTLLAEYGPRLASASVKQLTSFAGLDVVRFESGSSVHRKPRISKQGNWRIRRALYLAALTACRHNPTLEPYYRKKCKQGLEPKQALVAVMRKLIHIAHGVLKHQTPFQKVTA